MKITIITLSDRAFRGEYEDRSGRKIAEILKEEFREIEIRRTIISDEKEKLLKAFRKNIDTDFIITTGGTGIGPRDITPEATKEFCEKELPGIAEILRLESYNETPMAMLSRAFAGMKGKTIIVNFPGSVKAVILCTKVLIKIIPHAVKMLNGEGH